MAQRSARRDRENQCHQRARARRFDVDPVRELPYRPNGGSPSNEAGRMAASDHAPRNTPTFSLPRQGRPDGA